MTRPLKSTTGTLVAVIGCCLFVLGPSATVTITKYSPSSLDGPSYQSKTKAVSTVSEEKIHINTHTRTLPPKQVEAYNPRPPPLRTLVVVVGNLRCGERAWKSLYENVLDYNHTKIPHELDLALVIGDPVNPIYRNASLFERAKFVWTFPEYGDDWSGALNLIDPEWKSKVAPLLASTSIALGGVKYANWHGSGAISFWIRWFLAQKLMEHNLTTRYDRFVITRTDHYYLCAHDLSLLDPQYLWVPHGQDYGGITDRHSIIPSQYIIQALDILPGLFENPDIFPDLGDVMYNPERLLRDRWKQEGLDKVVKRFPRMMFTCSNPDAEDSTRWKAGGDIIPDAGVRRKYRKEYAFSDRTCNGDSSEDNNWRE